MAWLSLGDLRATLTLAILCLACYQDVKTREIDDRLWYVLIGLGLPMVALELSTRLSPVYLTLYVVSVCTGLALSAALYYAKLMGGADAKAIMAFSLLELPAPWRSILSTIPPLAILTNAVILSVATPLILMLRNIILFGGRLWKEVCRDEPLWKRALAILVLTKVKVGEYREKPHAYVLAEDRSSGCTRIVLNLSAPEDIVLPPEELRDEEEVWVSYLLPYILVLTAGYATYKTAGPLLELLLRAWLS